jgi:uroporphyrinogen III methyltransferase / synthase
MNDDSQIRLRARGRVFLVGAGPGDPELLTMRAYRLLTTARVVAYDELVSPEILALARPDAELVPVGRRRGTCPEAPAIHPAVLERAIDGDDVVRLKGGDPMIFGRGGEEAEQLAALAIPFEIVPGVSAALGAAASAGIPLTHRDAAASVAFVTAHKRHDAEDDDLAARVPREGTVVLYMGLATLRETARTLVAAGRSPSTPVAVVAHATLPTQREVVATLATVADAVEAARLPAPALVIVGDVVGRRVAPQRAAAAPLAPPRSRSSNTRSSRVSSSPAAARSSSEMRGATTRTRAPAARRSRALRDAMTPAPKTTTSRPTTSRKRGSSRRGSLIAAASLARTGSARPPRRAARGWS